MANSLIGSLFIFSFKMGKFFKKAFVLALSIVTFIIAAIFFPSKPAKQDLLYAQIDKNKLLKNTPSPRMIFVGGSNLSFGLNSKMLKDSLHVNPINTGIHAGIGLKYMIANTLQYVKQGDVIVISAEYQQFFGNLAYGTNELFSEVIDIVPESRNLIDYKQYIKLIQLAPEFAQTKLRPILLFYNLHQDTSINIYDRKAFNVYGDAFLHWKMTGKTPKPYSAITERFNDDILKDLINFKNKINQKKAKLYVTFPGYQFSSYKISIPAIKQVQQRLKNNGFSTISTPEEFIMPDSLIFDTPYHLIKRGVDYRTELLLNDLKKLIR